MSEKQDKLILNLVQGAMSLCSCGGSHEIERDEELCEGMDLIEECENVENGVILHLEDGQRYKISVQRL